MANHIVGSTPTANDAAPAAPDPHDLPTDRVARVALLGEGPWVDEPDRMEWRAHGYPCLMVRNGHLGNWCGYVAVPPGHPLHGKDYEAVHELVSGLDVHCGLTYSRACAGRICHVPAPGEPDDVWWLGFDCGHSGDLCPGTIQSLRACRAASPEIYPSPVVDRWLMPEGEEYRDVDYVRRETENLAKQIAAFAARVGGSEVAP